MDAENSSPAPVNAGVSGTNSADDPVLPAAHLPKHEAIARAAFLWRMLRWPFLVFCSTWIRVRASGQEHIDHSRGGLFLINHQSFLDPMLVAVRLTRPISYLARDNLFRIPILGWILRNTHVIPISREAARGGSIRIALEQLDAGFLVGIFPEGTRSIDDEVHRFRPGFIAIVRRATQPIYPVGIAGFNRVMPKGAWFIRPGRVQIVYGTPFTADEVSQFQSVRDDAALCELARSRVAECAKLAATLLSEN
jgi:1-acyl-sn-glycerol-3-phosphate acyltransferase